MSGRAACAGHALPAAGTRAVEREVGVVLRCGSSLSPSCGARVFEPVALSAPDGLTLEGVVLTHGDTAGPYWILFCPAAGTSVHGELGYNVLAFDYRDFGENRGSPTEEGVYADAAAAYSYLTRLADRSWK